jgi:hypothetical protein
MGAGAALGAGKQQLGSCFPLCKGDAPMSMHLGTLSVAVREVRVRVARDDIHAALGPVSRHSEAARLSLELDDDKGLEHHLRRVVDGVRLAARKHRELTGLLSSSAPIEIPREATA